MPRRHKRRSMKGGFWDSLTQGFSSAWEKTKKATTDAYSSATGSTSSTPQSTPPPPPPPSTTTQPTSTTGFMGGRTRRRRMRGGFKDNTPTTGLAAHAAPFSGPTAQPHNWVGGRTKKRCHRKHRHTKSCRHRR
jgi:hypothetical protein